MIIYSHRRSTWKLKRATRRNIRIEVWRGIRFKENDFVIENMLSWRCHANLRPAMDALYYTPHYAEYDVHVRMPSADAAWISNVPYCLVCGHTLKFKTMDDVSKQKKTKACVPLSPDVSLSRDIFGPLSEQYYAIHSFFISFPRAVFSFFFFFFYYIQQIC